MKGHYNSFLITGECIKMESILRLKSLYGAFVLCTVRVHPILKLNFISKMVIQLFFYHLVSIKRKFDDGFMNLKCLNIPLALLVKVFQVLYSKVDVCDFASPPFLERMP